MVWALLLQPDFTVDREAFQHYKDTYREAYLATVELLPAENILGRMEDFFGQSMDSYNVVLVSLFHSGGFGPDLRKQGEVHNYSLIGPSDTHNHISVFFDEDYFTDLEIHELGHSFIPIANEADGPFAALVQESEFLFAPIEEDMRNNAYDIWDTALEELILRGCVIKIMEDFDPERAAALQAEERENGFIYIDTVCASIETYLQNRQQYTGFNGYIPELIQTLISVHQPQ